MRLIAKVENITDNIKYLGIEYDNENLDHGVYLFYLLENDFETCQHDGWFMNLEIAKQVASDEYGIKENAWKEYEK